MKIYVDNYGSPDNFSCPLQNAISELKDGDELVFSEKEYHFLRDFSLSKRIHMTNTDSFQNPIKYFGILFENKKNITISGNGAVFHIHGDMCAMALLNCSGVSLRDFTVHYPSPSNIEFEVLRVENNRIQYRLSSGDFEVKDKSITFFEKSPFDGTRYFEFTDNEMTDCWVCHDSDEVYRVWNENSPLSGIRRINRISKNEIEIEYETVPALKTGAVYAISPNHNRHTSGIFFNECNNINSENITVNYLAGFGWLSQMCHTLSFKSIRFVPDKAHRVTSLADLLHICACKGKVEIADCLFTNPHDDAINIHGVFLRLNKVINETTALFEFAHSQQGGYQPFFEGDKARFYGQRDLSIIGNDYTVKTVNNNINKKTVVIEFNEPLPSLKEHMTVVDNITYHPDVNISGCTFRSVPTRAILCSSGGKVKIHTNHFSHIQMANILVSGDAAEWYESGAVNDMEIFDNTFENDDYVLLIHPIAKGKPANDLHRHIRFHSNRILNPNKSIKEKYE